MLSRAFNRSLLTVAPKGIIRPAFIRALSTADAPKGSIRPAFTYAPDTEAGKAYIAQEEATVAHSKGTGEFWRKVSLFIVAPIIAMTVYHVYNVESAHFEHLAAHPRKPDDETPAEYDYQNVRNSK